MKINKWVINHWSPYLPIQILQLEQLCRPISTNEKQNESVKYKKKKKKYIHISFIRNICICTTHNSLLIDAVRRRGRAEAGRGRGTGGGWMWGTSRRWDLGAAGWWLLGCAAVVLFHRHRGWWFHLTGSPCRPHDTRYAVHRRGEDTPTIGRSHACLHHVLRIRIACVITWNIYFLSRYKR